MKNVYKIFLILLLMTQVALANVPSIHTIYETLRGGNLSEAHRMIERVLRVHPRSAKAHYVAAEILAREGNLQKAKDELHIAQKIEPNLSFVRRESVVSLEDRINRSSQVPVVAKSHSWIPWIIVAIILFILYLLWKKSSNKQMTPYQRHPSNQQHPNSGQTAQYGGNSGGGMFGGGLFSSILSGLGMGAGFAAGERIVDDLMGSNDENHDADSHQTPVDSDQGYSDSTDNDFGIDNSSSWDDDSSFGSDDFGSDDSSW